MEKIKTEEVRRERGRPKLDACITEEYAPSRRQALNKMYLYEGIHLLSVAATEIPNSEVLWQEDRTAVTVKSRDGILEKLGRMTALDKRLTELEKLVVSAYEDERRSKLEQRTQLASQLEVMREDEQTADEWMAVIRDYTQLEELDRPTLLRLVKRIEVGEKYQVDNEWLVKDTSKKIRAVKRSKGMSGKPVISKPVYGYLMDKDENFIIDEEAAPVVKQIYSLCLAGNGSAKIARMLTEQEIPTLGTLEYRWTGSIRRYHPGYECKWAANTVVHILETGNIRAAL